MTDGTENRFVSRLMTVVISGAAFFSVAAFLITGDASLFADAAS